jgi:colanic acid/amylovoran biosynthesis glycosyltransferase
MKIGIILSNTPGKSETFLYALIRGLIENGHDIIVFANKNDNFKICPIYLKPKVSKYLFIQFFKLIFCYSITFFNAPRAFLKYLNLEKEDGVKFIQRWKNLYFNSHIIQQSCEWIHFSFTTLVLTRENVASSINAKMSTSMRGYDLCIFPLKNPGCYKNIWSKLDKIHSISKDILKAAVDEGLDDLAKAVIINPAINENFFKKKNKSSIQIHKKKKIKFLTVARLHWKKGLEDTLYAMSILKKNKIHFDYTIVGEGVEIERLVYLRNQLNLNREVIFAGAKDHNDIRHYYDEADIYIQYSIQEGFSNAVIEAQSMELLIFVSNAEGLSENIQNEKTGWIVEKYSPASLAKKIQEILKFDLRKIEKIQTAARERVINKFSLIQQKNKFNKFFKKN